VDGLSGSLAFTVNNHSLIFDFLFNKNGNSNSTMGRLTIYLDKATNLQRKDRFSQSDPYVRFDLKHRNLIRDYGFQRSSAKKNERNPIYNETFVFDNIPALYDVVLKVRIRDKDLFTRDDTVGRCDINLNDLRLTSTPMSIERIVDRNYITKDAMVYLKLSYEP
jgi:Ca2+-dependent lipid-binding protein